MQYIMTLLTYLFEPLPSGPFKYLYIFLGLGIAAIIASIAVRILLKKQKEDKIFKKLFRDLPGKLQLFGIIELIYAAVRFERIPYFSIRFLNYAVLAWALYFTVRSVQMYLQIYPVQRKKHEEQVRLNQYLPRKGNKRKYNN